MSDIEARVKKIIAEQLGFEESKITNEKSFVADLGADSLEGGAVDGIARLAAAQHFAGNFQDNAFVLHLGVDRPWFVHNRQEMIR